jgi:hypothetical protein
VQAVIRGQLSAEEQVTWLENTARLLAEVFDVESQSNTIFPKAKRTFPHVVSLINYAETQTWLNGSLANLLRKAGLYLSFNGDNPRAQSMLEK